MHTKAHALPAWVEDERSLMTHLVNPHAGDAYAEDLLEAVALMTSWVMIGMSALLAIGVLIDGFVRLA